MLSVSRKESLRFINEKLGVEGIERRFAEGKHALLNDMIVAFHNNIPFQTLTNMAANPKDRRIPSPDEIKDDLFNGRGGVCVALNGFFYAVLKAIGYDAYVTGAKMYNDDEFLHVLVIVKDLDKPGDSYLVDVGIGYPTLQAVPLDFEVESPVVPGLLWFGRFIRLPAEEGSEQCFDRFARMRKPRYPDIVKQTRYGNRDLLDQWNQFYQFSLEPCSLEELSQIIDKGVFRNLEHMLNRTLILFKCKNGRAIAIYNDRLMMEDGEGNCHSRLLETEEDIPAFIDLEFPVYEKSSLQSAIVHWKRLKDT